MKDRFVHVASLLASVLLVVSAVIFVGCEKSTGANPLVISPAVVSLQGSNSANSVTFTVSSNNLRTLSYPLMWSVSRPELGAITSSAGNSAVYVRRNETGVNIITVVDQYDETGQATVYQ